MNTALLAQFVQTVVTMIVGAQPENMIDVMIDNMITMVGCSKSEFLDAVAQHPTMIERKEGTWKALTERAMVECQISAFKAALAQFANLLAVCEQPIDVVITVKTLIAMTECFVFQPEYGITGKVANRSGTVKGVDTKRGAQYDNTSAGQVTTKVQTGGTVKGAGSGNGNNRWENMTTYSVHSSTGTTRFDGFTLTFVNDKINAQYVTPDGKAIFDKWFVLPNGATLNQSARRGASRAFATLVTFAMLANVNPKHTQSYAAMLECPQNDRPDFDEICRIGRGTPNALDGEQWHWIYSHVTVRGVTVPEEMGAGADVVEYVLRE